jgi:hypothetical protein
VYSVLVCDVLVVLSPLGVVVAASVVVVVLGQV